MWIFNRLTSECVINIKKININANETITIDQNTNTTPKKLSINIIRNIITITLNEWSCKVCNHIVAILNLLLPKGAHAIQLQDWDLILLYEHDTNIINHHYDSAKT